MSFSLYLPDHFSSLGVRILEGICEFSQCDWRDLMTLDGTAHPLLVSAGEGFQE